MTENIASKFTQLSIRSENSGSENVASFHTNGDDEKGSRANPWKPSNLELQFFTFEASSVPAEKSTLEADAWPEPSAPSEQRGGATRGSEEKHKSANVRPFRRGMWYGNYRNRLVPDTGRGRSNGYYRQPGRVGSVRLVYDQKRGSEKLSVSTGVSGTDKSFSGGSDQSNQEDRISLNDHVVNENQECSAVQVSEVDNNKVATHSPNSRKTYRDRIYTNVQSANQGINSSTNYDPGPIGRARRSYQRSQQPLYPLETDHNTLGNHSTMVANSTIPALLPFHQVAYIIPGAPGTMLNAAIPLPQAASQHAVLSGGLPPVSLANQTIISGQPTVQHPVGALSHIPVDSLPISILPDVSTVPQVYSHQTSNFSNVSQTGESLAEVVDVNQMIAYINDVGWKKVNFPTVLREQPAVAAAIRDSMSHFNQAAGDSTVNKSETSSISSNQSKNDENMGKTTKADVVVVDDKVFFVPRNANRTKFLKFVSKLDYIKHHVEYYFSESNLQRDMHLYSILSVNNDVCPLSELLQFNRLKWVSTNEPELLDAVSNSTMLTIICLPDGVPFGISRVVTIPKTLDGSIIDNSYTGTAQPIYLGVPGTVSNPGQVNSVSQVASVSQHHSVTTSISAAQPSSFSLQQSTYTSTNTLQSSAVIGGISVPSSSPNLSNYVQTSGYVVNPNMIVGTNAALINVPYSISSQMQSHGTATTLFSHFPQSDLINNIQMRPVQPTFFTPQLYSQLQAALVASANATNQPALLSPGLVNPTAPTADQNVATPYRLNAPGNAAQLVGTYVPTMGNTVGFGNGSNPAVFLQFIPGAHPNQPGAFFGPGSIGYPPSTTALINRPMVPANPNGMWISLNPATNAAANIASAPYHLQPYVAFPHGGHGNLQPAVSGTNGVLYSTNSPHLLSNSFTAVPIVRPDAPYGNQKITNMNSRNHVYVNQPTVSSGVNAAPSPIISNHNSTSSLSNATLSQSNNMLNKRVS